MTPCCLPPFSPLLPFLPPPQNISGMDLHDPRNIILVRPQVGVAFKKFYFTIIPTTDTDGKSQWQVGRVRVRLHDVTLT